MTLAEWLLIVMVVALVAIPILAGFCIARGGSNNEDDDWE